MGLGVMEVLTAQILTVLISAIFALLAAVLLTATLLLKGGDRKPLPMPIPVAAKGRSYERIPGIHSGYRVPAPSHAPPDLRLRQTSRLN